MALFGTYQAPAPTVDPAFAAMVGQQQQAANAYMNNAPNLAAQQNVQAEQNTRADLANKMSSIKSGSNKRGLLYSGLKQAQEAGAQGQAANNISNQAAQTNQQIMGQQQALQNQGTQAGFALQQANQQVLDTQYQNEMSQRQARQGAVAGVLGAAGGLLGGVLGGK